MYIKVRAIAGAKKEEIIEEKPQYYRISVREKAERNEANARIIFLIAQHYQVKESDVRINNGHHSPSKLLSINTI